ncbi:MAG: hypothetical protein R3330_13180, partial [Saprospiraceae bacterium]|nr:hypothetical protein [Saprospiraceae bacterium]
MFTIHDLTTEEGDRGGGAETQATTEEGDQGGGAEHKHIGVSLRMLNTRTSSTMHFFTTCCVLVMFLTAFASCENASSSNQPDPDYLASIESWRAQRLAALKRPRGWASLVGLDWLQEGRQTFGSAPDMDIRLPDHGPDHVGDWQLIRDSVWLEIPGDLVIMNATDTTQFDGGLIRTDAIERPHLLQYSSFYWMVIRR